MLNQMIKIEFKEAQITEHGTGLFCFIDEEWLNNIRKFSTGFFTIKSINTYTPTQDPMLDREHILTQLGITKEQDEANQKEWSKL